jgi:geranylgeranyl pyrophosphate synthase
MAGSENRSEVWLHLPYWRVLPVALRTRFRSGTARKPIRRKFLHDVQWAQYCLFLCIRFQDDVFDGQNRDAATIFASDQCLLEADRVFAKYFSPRSWFWREYRESFRLTTQSIVEVDALQRKSTSRPDELLDGYARVSSILKIGSAAVCAKLHQKSAYKRVSRFCDELAKAGQIMDDIHDLEEDLGRKRFNYMANVLRRSEKKMPKRARSNELLNQLRILATMEKIYDEARTHVSRASAAIYPLEIPGMKKYLAHYHSSISPHR